MKRVVDQHTVAHLWANELQEEARTPTGNLFFNRDIIFSYGTHFTIAQHVNNANGEKAILLTERTYSNTTSGHVKLVSQAARHLKLILVPNLNNDRHSFFDDWFSEIKAIATHLPRARKPERYILEIQGIVAKAKIYADFFGYRLPDQIQEAGAVEDNAQFNEILRKEGERFKAEQEKKRLAQLVLQQTQLKEWRAFKRSSVISADGFDYLRFNKAAEHIETSQRVSIPQAVAQQFYGFVLETIAKGGCNNCEGRLYDRYQILEINKSYIRVGCHKINAKEIKVFTKKMGW